MPKKQPKNAFFFFMLHFKEEERRRGRFYSGAGGMVELSAAASKPWKDMNAQQRGPFEKEAKEAKTGPARVQEKFTSQGIPLSIIDKEQKEADNEHRTMLRTIKNIVQTAFSNNTMGSEELTFISGNYFVNVKETYLPAELAMVKMTFENGIVNKFHTYVDPETLPLGYQFEAKENSEKTHRLPIPPRAKGEKNYLNILNEMNKFMGDPTKILFTTKDCIPMIKSFIQSFVEQRGEDYIDPNHYRVYPLHQLFFEIKEEAVKNSMDGVSFKSIHIAEEHLKREDYAYLTGTACAYHEELDCAKHCALAHVQNWAYIFADHICVDLNIMPITGKHFPPEIDVSHVVADMTRSNFSASQLNDSDTDTVHFVDEPEPFQRRSRPVPSVPTSHWAPRPKSPASSTKDDNFPSLGSHSRRAGSSKKRSDERDSNNPWNTSSSSSSTDSNPWNQRRDDTADSSARGSDLDSSYSRGMGRGSLLFRHESGFGRGRSHKDRSTESSHSGGSSRRDRSKRRRSSDSSDDDRSNKRR